MADSNKEISQWVKNKNGQPIGHLVAFTPHSDLIKFCGYKNLVYVGYSFCDTRFDKFKRDEAQFLSEERAIKLVEAKNLEKILSRIPYKYKKDFHFFMKRVKRYFKNCNKPVWVNEYNID